MPSRRLTSALLGCVIAHSLAFTRAADSPPPASTNDIPENLALWTHTVNLRSWAGYKDNVLLGNAQVEGSPFVAAGVDAFLLRLTDGGLNIQLFAGGEHIQFMSTDLVDKEQSLIGQARVSREFGDAWEAWVSADYLYFDQVFDATLLDEDFATVRAQGHNLGARLGAKRKLGDHYWIKVEPDIMRQTFKDLLDDYWEGGPKAAFGYDYGRGSELWLGYEYDWRVHDTRRPRDTAGNSMDGSLTFYQHETTLGWRHFWDTEKRWRSTTKASVEKTLDNGLGYYDYMRYTVSEQVRYRTETWEIQAQVKFAWYDYDIQTVAPGGPSRSKRNLLASLRGEKQLIKKLRLFAEYEHERSDSNLAFDEYAANVVFAGVDWEF